MGSWQDLTIDLIVIAIFIAGIAQFQTPKGARRGNLTTVLAFAAALALLFYRNSIGHQWIAIPAFVVGGALGWYVSARVNMTRIPALIALQNGAGGGASLAVSLVELVRMDASSSPLSMVFGVAGAVVGGVALSGSVVAAAKLENRMNPRPKSLPAHNTVMVALVAASVALGTGAILLQGPAGSLVVILLAIATIALGVGLSVRVGGADMPVMISLLNAFSGLAAAFVGVTIGNQMLVAAGAMVGSSGTILTLVMARAMNRGIGAILVGRQLAQAVPASAPTPAPASDAEPAPQALEIARPEDSLAAAREVLATASSVIIVPGYGMALAQAQGEVASLAARLESEGKTVRFAVHPVAGRMPGHMHVLLAEADVEYEKLFEMAQINDDFARTDAVIIVGACDVVNPAANSAADTPISGMPILLAHEAGAVIVCNYDEKPGYSGVPNPLYEDSRAILLFGDAKETVGQLLDA